MHFDTLNDAKLEALRVYLGVTGGQVTQLEKDYLVLLGASGDSVNELWMDYLENNSAFPQDPGQFNDMAYGWLGDLGYTGNMNERWKQYWQAIESTTFDRITEDGEFRLTESAEYRITD